MPGGQGPGCAPSSQKPLPVLLHGLLGKIPAFPAAATGLCPAEALDNHKPASSRTVAGAFPKLFPFAHTFKGRGRMGALRAEPAALGRCCARSRDRSAKGNTNILPKESTFHRQHRFPFLHRAGLFQAAFPTALPGRARAWPSFPGWAPARAALPAPR